MPPAVRYQREVIKVNATKGWIEINVPVCYALKTRDNPNVQKIKVRYGYIIGTSASMDQVSVGGNFETNTAAHDAAQFISNGEALVPQSLWLPLN